LRIWELRKRCWLWDSERTELSPCRGVQYASLERAIAWLENHENDADIDDPVEETGGNVLGSATGETLSVDESQLPPERTEEEQAARAAAVQVKLAERRKVTEQKDKDDAVLKEKIRRKEGQSLAEMREKRQADDMKKIAEERKQEKLNDQRARKEVLEKIKQDRAAKEAKKNAASTPAPQPAVAVQTTPQPKKDYDECRLQLRLPTGQPLVNTFKAEDTLGDVAAFIRDTAALEEFNLMTSFPRKQYQHTDYGFSLKSLGLCPSSVVIVSKK